MLDENWDMHRSFIIELFEYRLYVSNSSAKK